MRYFRRKVIIFVLAQNKNIRRGDFMTSLTSVLDIFYDLPQRAHEPIQVFTIYAATVKAIIISQRGYNVRGFLPTPLLMYVSINDNPVYWPRYYEAPITMCTQTGDCSCEASRLYLPSTSANNPPRYLFTYEKYIQLQSEWKKPVNYRIV